MRLAHLLGLAGLAAASPTPARTHLPQGLTVFAQGDAGYAIDAVHRCVLLDAPVYMNVHAYQATDLVCNFMASERCGGKVVLTTDARGTVSVFLLCGGVLVGIEHLHFHHPAFDLNRR